LYQQRKYFIHVSAAHCSQGKQPGQGREQVTEKRELKLSLRSPHQFPPGLVREALRIFLRAVCILLAVSTTPVVMKSSCSEKRRCRQRASQKQCRNQR